MSVIMSRNYINLTMILKLSLSKYIGSAKILYVWGEEIIEFGESIAADIR